MRPLDGIKVVDFTQAHAGSLATMILADFGAEVIKIERAGVGDLARYWAPMKGDDSGYYAYLNRGKKSISIDARKEEGKEIIRKLVAEADVVCENFKYGSMDRMGLSYEELKKINPNIIYASLNGFGQNGPIKKAIGLDLQLQAMSGVMDRTGFNDGPPTKVGAALGDQLSGTYMAMAINLALIHKKKTGEGQSVDIAILDALFSVLEAGPATQSLKNKLESRSGNTSILSTMYDVLETKDGFVMIGIENDDQWRRICEVLKLEELSENVNYSTNQSRIDNFQEGIKVELEKVTLTMNKRDIEKLFVDNNLICGAVNTVKEAMATDQVASRDMLVNIEDKVLGKLMVPGIAIKLSKTPGKITEGAPLLGEHTDSYLENLGYSMEMINKLHEDGIVEKG